MTQRPPRYSFLLLVLCLLFSLIPIWFLHYLPLQDYPQNLFQAKLTAESLAGHPLDSAIYQVHLKLTYSVFFLAVWAFQFFLPLSLAGKAAASLYPLLVAFAAWRIMKRTPRAWPAALLLFPAAVNQIYFLGFFHYLYAMPVLLLALLHLLDTANEGWTPRSLIVHLLYLLLLVWLHPFALALYALVAASWLLPFFNKTFPFKPISLGLFVSVLIAIAWIVPGLLGKPGSVSTLGLYFQSPLKNAAFLFYLFTGMRGPSSPDLPTLLLWSVTIALLLMPIFKKPQVANPLRRPIIAATIVLTLALLFTPFGTANASYLNVRIVVPIYFLLVFLATLMPAPRGASIFLPLLTLLLLANAFLMQRRLGRETAKIEPIVAAMQSDALVLPLLFDRESPECDGYYFSMHLDDHFYYHLAKGGASPYLLEAPNEGRAPVSFRPGMQPPAPDAYFPTNFRWEKCGQPYHYFLVRGGSPSLYAYMERGATLRATSGKWRLYEHNSASSQPAH